MFYLKTFYAALSMSLLFNQVFTNVLLNKGNEVPSIDDKTLHYLADVLNKAVVNVVDALDEHKLSGKMSNATLDSRSTHEDGMNFIQAVQKMNSSLPEFFKQFGRHSGLPTDVDLHYDPATFIVVGMLTGLVLSEGYRNLPIIIRATSDHLLETRKSLGEAVDKVVANNPRLTRFDRKKVPKLEMDKMYKAENMIYPEIPERFRLTA